MSYTVTAKSGETFTFPDGFPPEQAKAAMDAHFAKHKPSIPATGLGATFALLSGRTPEFLPSILGFAGGMAGRGGPGRIAGAAAGGAIGEGIREMYRGQPISLGEIGASGASQAAQQGIGEGIASGFGRMTRPMIRKTVSFQRAETPSVILNEFGKPFMVPGAQVEFRKRAPKEARHAADVAMDVASHALGPGGALVRPVMRGLRGKVATGASGIGSFINSPVAKMFARNFPRAFAALKQLATLEDQPDTTGVGF
jgi:hypothetical protein